MPEAVSAVVPFCVYVKRPEAKRSDLFHHVDDTVGLLLVDPGQNITVDDLHFLDGKADLPDLYERVLSVSWAGTEDCYDMSSHFVYLPCSE